MEILHAVLPTCLAKIAKEGVMPANARIYLNKYSSVEWDIMSSAYTIAVEQIGRHPNARKDRLAHAIMSLFDRGIHEVGLLSTLAVNREASLAAKKRKKVGASFTTGLPEYLRPAG